MTEKTIYIAYDGKEFEDYDECIQYEQSPIRYGVTDDTIKLYDYHYERLLLNSTPISKLVDESIYVKWIDRKSLDWFNRMIEEYQSGDYTIDSEDETGYAAWCDDCWRFPLDEVERWTTIISHME